MDVLVVGAGEMGRWFVRTLGTHLADPPTVAFADADRPTAEAAAHRLEDTPGDGLEARAVALETDDHFDLVCVAVPIPATAAAIAAHARQADRAICDLAGIMAAPIDAMTEHAADRERVSFHPLFAPANAPGNVPLVADAPGPVTDRVRAALTAAGNDLFETTPAEHDRAMETVQARTHAAVLAFGLAADPVPDRFQTPISVGLFDLLEQVTGGEARVYSDIQAAFSGAGDVADAAREVAEADPDRFAELYRRAEPRTDDE